MILRVVLDHQPEVVLTGPGSPEPLRTNTYDSANGYRFALDDAFLLIDHPRADVILRIPLSSVRSIVEERDVLVNKPMLEPDPAVRLPAPEQVRLPPKPAEMPGLSPGAQLARLVAEKGAKGGNRR